MALEMPVGSVRERGGGAGREWAGTAMRAPLGIAVPARRSRCTPARDRDARAPLGGLECNVKVGSDGVRRMVSALTIVHTRPG